MRPLFNAYPHVANGYPLAFCIAVCQYIDMFCIYCFHKGTRVSNSRPHKKQPSVWRRRTCQHCKRTFTTTEQPSLDGVAVYHGRHHTPFNIGQLTISIAAAFQHRPEHGKQQAYWLARSVETWLATEHQHITTDDVEAATHQILQRYDNLAALQYAAQHQHIAQ